MASGRKDFPVAFGFASWLDESVAESAPNVHVLRETCRVLTQKFRNACFKVYKSI